MQDKEKKSFFGIGLSASGVPVDVLPVYHLTAFIPEFSLLVVDEFARLGGLKDEVVDRARGGLLDTVSRLENLYGMKVDTALCSDFMGSEEYSGLLEQVEAEIAQRPGLEDLVLETVPTNRRNLASARDYLIREFACVKYLSERGFSRKLGPSQEVPYDRIMSLLGFDVDFAYLLDAYALGTKSPDKVVHYSPESRGPNNGQRILFGDSERIVKRKLQMGCDDALRYFCRIASVSGRLLGNDYLAEDELSVLSGRKLKQKAVRIVLDNVIEPYMEVK